MEAGVYAVGDLEEIQEEAPESCVDDANQQMNQYNENLIKSLDSLVNQVLGYIAKNYR